MITITTSTYKSTVTNRQFTKATIYNITNKGKDSEKVSKSYDCTEEKFWEYLMDCFTVFETENLVTKEK